MKAGKDKKYFKGIPNCSPGKDLDQVSKINDWERYSPFLIFSEAFGAAVQITSSFLPQFLHDFFIFTLYRTSWANQ